MQLDDIGEVIAERTLKRSVNGGQATDVIVRLGRPRPFDDRSGYFCPFEILGLAERKVQSAAGVDAFQSLQLVFRMISALLHYKGREPDVELHWLAPGDDLGFAEPV
jgi:hypothetical protein